MGWRRKPDGRPYADVVIDGKRRRISLLLDGDTGTPDDAECQRRYEAFARQVVPALEAQARARKVPRSATLLDVLQFYENHLATARPSTRRVQSRTMARFFAWCEQRHISAVSEVTPALCHEYVVALIDRRLMPSSIRYNISVIRAAFRAAADYGIIPEDPVKRWPAVRTPAKQIEVFSPEEMRLVLDAVRRYAPTIYPLIVFLAATGWRIGDALALRYEHLDLFRRRAVFRQGKTSKGFGIRLSQAALDAIQLAGTDSGYVFQTVRGAHMTYPTVSCLLHRAARAASIQFRVNPHKFRHTLATQMARDAVPPTTIAAILGHSSVRTTIMQYQHYYPGEETEYVEDYAARMIDGTPGRHPLAPPNITPLPRNKL